MSPVRRETLSDCFKLFDNYFRTDHVVRWCHNVCDKSRGTWDDCLLQRECDEYRGCVERSAPSLALSGTPALGSEKDGEAMDVGWVIAVASLGTGLALVCIIVFIYALRNRRNNKARGEQQNHLMLPIEDVQEPDGRGLPESGNNSPSEQAIGTNFNCNSMDRKHYYQLVGQLKEVDVTSPKTIEDVDNNDALTMETYLDSSARTCVKIAQVHPLNYQQGTAHV